jgi:hypothetical protein
MTDLRAVGFTHVKHVGYASALRVDFCELYRQLEISKAARQKVQKARTVFRKYFDDGVTRRGAVVDRQLGLDRRGTTARSGCCDGRPNEVVGRQAPGKHCNEVSLQFGKTRVNGVGDILASGSYGENIDRFACAIGAVS